MFDLHLKHLAGVGIDLIFLMLASLPLLIIGVVLALIVLAWWIADMVIFANNDRTDGNGCPLIASL